MATKKTTKARTARPTGKKGIAKKATSRTTTTRAIKRTASAGRAKASAPKARVMVVPPAEPLFRAAELDGLAPKPVRKAEAPRPPRPPARLPIPQSTYFF
jgi:hypothetical protein